MNPLNQHGRDTLALAAASAGLVGLTSHQLDKMHAMGVYHVDCKIPVAHMRAEYADLRDHIALLESQHKFAQADAHMSELLAIPQEIMWKDQFHNLVTTIGGNNMLDNHLSGSAYTATWFMGLISNVSYTTGPVAGDTAASHPGWTEAAGYSNATRPAAAWAAASARTKALSAGLVFNINAAATIRGAFLISNSTKSGTTGVLFSAGLFTGGDQPVVDTNTLTATYQLTV